jgi:hypothetical protein
MCGCDGMGLCVLGGGGLPHCVRSGNYAGSYGFVKSLSSMNRYTIVIGGARSILKRRHQFKRDSSAQARVLVLSLPLCCVVAGGDAAAVVVG